MLGFYCNFIDRRDYEKMKIDCNNGCFGSNSKTDDIIMPNMKDKSLKENNKFYISEKHQVCSARNLKKKGQWYSVVM